MVAGVIARSRQGVELVKEQYARLLAREFEDLADIGGRLAQVGRDQPIQLDNEEGQTQLAGENLGAKRLAASRRAAEHQFRSHWQAVPAYIVGSPKFLEQSGKDPQVLGAQNDIGLGVFGFDPFDEFAGGVGEGDQRRQGLGPGGPRMSGFQGATQGASQNLVVLLFFFFDDLLGDRAEFIVAAIAGEQLFHQIAAHISPPVCPMVATLADSRITTMALKI